MFLLLQASCFLKCVLINDHSFKNSKITTIWIYYYINLIQSLHCYKVLSLECTHSLDLSSHKSTMWLSSPASLWRPHPARFSSHCHNTSLPNHHFTHPRCCGKAQRHDLWHLKQGALKSLLSKSDRLGRLGRQGNWLTGLEAKRDPEAAALKCCLQHIEGSRGDGRVLAITGLTD